MAKLRSSLYDQQAPALTQDQQPTPQAIQEPRVVYVDRPVEVIKYVDRVESVVQYKDREIRVEVPTVQYVDRIVPRVETKEVRVEVPYPVKTVEYVNVTHEKIVNKLPVWSIAVMAIQLITIVTLILT